MYFATTGYSLKFNIQIKRVVVCKGQIKTRRIMGGKSSTKTDCDSSYAAVCIHEVGCAIMFFVTNNVLVRRCHTCHALQLCFCQKNIAFNEVITIGGLL